MQYQPTLGQVNYAPSQVAQQRVNPGQAFEGDQGASKLLGDLNRAQWNDWKSRFSPYVDRLAAVAQDGDASQKAAANASSAMGLSFDANQQAQDQDRQSFGVNLSPQQEAAQSRRNNVQRSASMVSAGNQARISAQDRQGAILAGGMGLSNIPDQVMNQ
ncbi:hypothetical protein [Halomonas sp. hl-4]|uniref:hypothetical protein n=1 Tax=Halomonas sp. hl-4 TaxID=1761789 RepID=UPI000BB6E3FF|nr:hypothetical protein [Halomonas sp. hl-4]SNY95583.1 hypothetical protein SAMN04488142_0084 [Halomonas sp. hl-4]